VAEDDLTVNEIIGRPARVSAEKTTGKFKWFAWNLPSNSYTGDTEWYFPIAAWTNEALAKIQDTAPEIDVPLAIAELKDLPRTIRSLYSRSLSPSRVADLHLTNQYGVRPIVSDVMAMLSLQRSLANRVKQHRKKYRTNRAGGSLSQGAFYIGTYNPSVDTVYNIIRYVKLVSDVERSYEHRAWFSARLTPQIPLSETLAAVVDNPLGIGQASPETLWNLIPWSFLIDYFADIADVLRVQGNLMPYHVESICIMCKATNHYHTYPRDHPLSSVTMTQKMPGRTAFVQKRRWVVRNPTATLALHPLLTGMQAANISALALSVFGKR
jgi:hypothetical protein